MSKSDKVAATILYLAEPVTLAALYRLLLR